MSVRINEVATGLTLNCVIIFSITFFSLDKEQDNEVVKYTRMIGSEGHLFCCCCWTIGHRLGSNGDRSNRLCANMDSHFYSLYQWAFKETKWKKHTWYEFSGSNPWKPLPFVHFFSVLGIESRAFLVHPRLHSTAEKHPSPLVLTWWEGRHWITGETGGDSLSCLCTEAAH